jgi:ribonuclease Z
MKRVLLVAGALLVVAGGLAYLFRAPLAMRFMERVVARNLGAGLLGELPDGLHVGLCGAGSPLPDPERSGPCVAVIAGSSLWIVDAGSGSSRVLSEMRIPQGRIRGVLLTHFHSDHIDGLGELMLQRWVGGAHDTPLPVYGPPGVETVVDGFDRAYALDAGYRTAHHGPAIAPPTGAGGVAHPFPLPADGESAVVVVDGDLTVTTFRVNHAPVVPAVGYRFDYRGRSAVVSGDTAKSANVERAAHGVDLLVHEALSPTLVGVLTRGAERAGATNVAQITRDIVGYHTTPVEAAEIARDAGVRQLLFYHIVPPLPIAPLREIFVEGVSAVYDGPVRIGRDGTFFTLPAGSDAIEHRELL